MFAIVAARRGPYWALQDQEKTDLGTALANVLRHVPLPERELGIAADIAAVGFVFYAIATPRLNYERELVAQGAAAVRGTVPPVPPPANGHVAVVPSIHETGETLSPLDGLDETIRQAFPEGLDLSNPEHVERLNRIAAGQ